MSRKFKTVDYEQTLDSTVKIRECLSPNHLARFIVQVIGLLDLSRIYARYAACGENPSHRKFCWDCFCMDMRQGYSVRASWNS